MPDVGAIAAAASSVMPSPKDFFNVGSTLFQNRQSRKFSEKMYNRQYNDALEFWHTQNEYNSPVQQMERFRQAGLNPNLIYGQGNSGPSSSIPVPDVVPAQFREPRFDGGNSDVMSVLLGQADLRIKAAQADNLQVQNDVIRQDAILRALQAERTGFDLQFDRNLVDVSADAKRESLRTMRLQNDVLVDRNAREAALNSSNLQEAAQRMLTMIEQRKSLPLERQRIGVDIRKGQQEIQNMIKDGVLKEFDVRLREKGINVNDPMWARYVGMFLSDVYEGRVTAGSIGKSVWSWIFGN